MLEKILKKGQGAGEARESRRPWFGGPVGPVLPAQAEGAGGLGLRLKGRSLHWSLRANLLMAERTASRAEVKNLLEGSCNGLRRLIVACYRPRM